MDQWVLGRAGKSCEPFLPELVLLGWDLPPDLPGCPEASNKLPDSLSDLG